MYLRPVEHDLLTYRQWLINNNLVGKWLFPSISRSTKHFNQHQYYQIMQRVGDLLGINYLGTHTMRKTSAYCVYEQTNHNIALVMKLLNHSSEKYP